MGWARSNRKSIPGEGTAVVLALKQKEQGQQREAPESKEEPACGEAVWYHRQVRAGESILCGYSGCARTWWALLRSLGLQPGELSTGRPGVWDGSAGVRSWQVSSSNTKGNSKPDKRWCG